MKNFYNIHNFVRVEVDSESINSPEHKNYLRFFEARELQEIDRIVSTKVYGPTLPPIQEILTSNGASFVHSLGIELRGKGIIFPASGGVGKTSLTSYLRNVEGFKFFGDDFVIVKEDTMYSFPSDFSIYPYHLELFPEIKDMEAGRFLKRRKYLFWFYFIRRAVNYFTKRLRLPLIPGWNAIYAKVLAASLVAQEKIGNKTILSASVFLERYDGEEITKEEISSSETVERVLEILKRELWLTNVTKEKVILTSVFSRIKCYQIRLPKKLSNSEYFKFMDQFLKSII